MATSITTTPSVAVYKAKPYHALDMQQWYDAGDTYDTGINTTQVQDDIDAQEIALLAGYPYADEGSFIAAVEAAMDAIRASVTSNISNPTFIDVLTQINADMISVIQGDTVTFPVSGAIYTCPECLANGKREILDEDGTPSGTYAESEVCDGFGFTEVQYIKNPNTDYIQAP